jgi:hypothetical protein
MCHSLTFLSHLESNLFLFLVSFNKFQQENLQVCGDIMGVMGVYSRPLIEALGPTIDLFWWYKPLIYGRLCPICFSKELGFGGSIYVFQVSYL